MARTAATARRFHRLIDRYWDFVLRDDPLFATRIGDHRFDDRLPAASERAQTHRLERLRTFLEGCRTIRRSSLPLTDRLDHDILARALGARIRRLELPAYPRPISKTVGTPAALAAI